ncbi:MAG: serine/threonine-protein kinase [Thermoguttaceae bacterium]
MDENRGEGREERGEDTAHASSASEEELLAVVQQYMRELEAGRRPSRAQWVARYPHLQPALGDCLDGVNLMHEAAASIKPSDSPSAGLGVGLQPGMPLGDFQIVREIGRGGMGIVYEATQLSLGRRVALKTLPLAAGFDPKYLQRFRQEAQAAAQLHHANIVPVYAVGCERGVNFYAMQLIDGQSLDVVIRQLCRETGRNGAAASESVARTPRMWTGAFFDVPPTEPLRRDASKPPVIAPLQEKRPGDAEQITRLSADLSTESNTAQVYRTMADLMAQAAEALEYAHRQGIIHRDIKPANLLVDMNRHLWIADFGLAHLHSEQNLTRTGDVLGTIRYASPEQVSGQRVMLDPRTDLYSLGATFYELITLRPVFTSATRQSLLQQILNHDPIAPRTIDRSIPPELETILLKLLSKRPEDRYGSAQELADDLRRFLRDEPILAQPPSFADRVRKWGRRHPAYVAALVIVMAAVIVISGASNYLIAQANQRTRVALAAERTRAEEAERNLQQARQAVDYMIQVSENDLASKFPLHPLQKRILETALVYYQGFIAYYHDNPSKEAELLAVQRRLKKVLDEMTVLEGAGQLILLGEKDIQADLGLDDAQRQRFDAIARQFADQRAEMLQGYQNLSADQRRERFVQLARASEQVTQSILSQRQVRRLKQIVLQLQGITAFNQPEIAESLKLSDAQRQTMRQIEVETFMTLGERSADSPDESTRRQRRRDLMHSAMKQCVAALSPDQATAWRDMTGEPFRGRLSVLLPGMFPPQ